MVPGKCADISSQEREGKRLALNILMEKKVVKSHFLHRSEGINYAGKKLCDKIVAAILQDTFTQPTGNKVTSRFYSYSEI